MTIQELKHQAKIEEWKRNIIDCRSRGLSVKQWCEENHYHHTTYYHWERELFSNKESVVRDDVNEVSFVEVPIQTIVNQEVIAHPEVPAISQSAERKIATIGNDKIHVDLYDGVTETALKTILGAVINVY